MPHADFLQALLADCARRDQSAFERLYRLTAPRLFALCISMLRREDLAEEVLQEAFLQIWRDAARFDPNRATAMTWMAVIIRHRALDLLRRRTESRFGEPEGYDAPDTEPGPLEVLLRGFDNHALELCLEQLSEEQRKSIVLSFFRGFTHQQLSDYLAAPLGTVKSWIRRGLGQLKRCLQP